MDEKIGAHHIGSLDRRRRRVTVGAAALAMIAGLSACGTVGVIGSGQYPQPPASAVTPAGSTPAAMDYDALALDELDKIVNGADGVTAGFDPTMQQRLSADGVAAGWAAYQKQFGDYQSHGDPEDVSRGDLTVVNVPLKMARKPGQFRITFHRDGHIAGLFLLKTGVPTP